MSAMYPLKHLDPSAADVWYTFYFDPEYVTVYASANGYDESEKSLATRYKHGIKDIAADGSVYLKISRSSCLLDEISLSSPRKGAAKAPKEGQVGEDK